MPDSLQRLLSLRQLRLVAVLGRELSLSRTAERLHTTQPALSRSLAQLEALLGTRLFDRTTKRITPTAAGVSLQRHAERILAQLDLAQEELAGLRAGISGEVRVGLLPTFGADLVARALARAREMLPEVLFIVRTEGLQALHQSLLAGRIDLMLSHAELTIDLDRIAVHRLYEEHSQVLAAPGHPLARRRKVTPADLAAHPWVLPPSDTPLRPKINRMLSVHRREGAITVRDVETDSMALAVGLVREAGMLWAVASRYAARFEAAEGLRRLAIGTPLLSGPMCAFHLRGEAMKAPSRVLLDCLDEQARRERD